MDAAASRTAPERGRAARIGRRALLGVGAAGGVLAGAAALDLGAAAFLYGPEYLWRIYSWRTYSADDGRRFPSRPFTAAPMPIRLAPDPAALPRIRAAFAAVSGSADLAAFAERTRTTSLIVLQHGRIALEAYGSGATRAAPQGSFSIAKSVTCTLVGAAIADGALPSVETPVETLLPDARHLRGSGIRIMHLLTMESGFRLRGRPFPTPLGTPWSDWEITYFATDLRRVALAVRPEYAPGTRFQYDDRNPMLLGILLERATGSTVSRFLERRIWHRIGAEYPGSWSLDSRRDGFEKMESGLNAAPIDYAKFGLMVLRGGVNQRGERVLPPDWIAAALTPRPHLANWTNGRDEAYGYLWWLFPRRDGPADACAEGVLGQALYVSRAAGLVILRTGTAEQGIDWPRLLHRWGGAIAA